MPKKKTYEQLERALKRAENKSARKESGWNRQIGHSATLAQEIRALKEQVKAKIGRIDVNAIKIEELEELALQVKLKTLTDRAGAAETNLLAFQAALVASNTVNLVLLDIVKGAQ